MMVLSFPFLCLCHFNLNFTKKKSVDNGVIELLCQILDLAFTKQVPLDYLPNFSESHFLLREMIVLISLL